MNLRYPQLVYKMRNGQPVEAAVEEIITRGVGELRKNAFGDDSEDAKNLPWKREQAWSVLKQLAKKDEVSGLMHLALSVIVTYLIDLG